MWSDEGLLEVDRTLPEGAETSSVSEISSHVCESFFMSPENTLECEQPIRKVYQSLSTAVDGLLEMALDSSKQVRPKPIPEASGEVGRQVTPRLSWPDSCYHCHCGVSDSPSNLQAPKRIFIFRVDLNPWLLPPPFLTLRCLEAESPDLFRVLFAFPC